VKSCAEVALVVDPQSARYLNDRHAAIPQIYQGTRGKLNRLGAPFEVLSFNDLPHADLDSYKLFVFPGLFEVTPEKLEVLKKYVFNKNRTVLFVYAPGICDGKSLDTARVKKLCGTEFGTKGISIVNMENWKSVYASDYVEVTPQVLKLLAADAGVNIYCEQEVPVFANSRLLAIHTASGGEIEVTLPGYYSQVTELYSGRIVAKDASGFVFTFAMPDTRMFELVK
jgi:hypothetical protein